MVALYQALGESDVVVTYMAYLGYMIRDIFYRVAHVLIIAIIARTITEDVGALSQKICSYAVGLLWIITLVGLGFDIAYYAEFIAMGGPEYIAAAGTAYTAIVEASYLFAFTLYLITLSVLAVLKQSSKVCSLPHPYKKDLTFNTTPGNPPYAHRRDAIPLPHEPHRPR